MILKKDNIVLGVSQKSDGQMILREGGPGLENRRIYFSRHDINPKRIVSAGLEHGNQVRLVKESSAGTTISGVDALVTEDDNLYLSVTVSDCVPIFFWADDKAVGIAHSGWRGTVANISFSVIGLMKDRLGISPEDINIYIGSHIKKCHFEIQEDVLNYFLDYPDAIEKREGRVFVSLERIIIDQLQEAGVKRGKIKVSDVCTYCSQDYFSYRRDRPERVVSQIAYISLI